MKNTTNFYQIFKTESLPYGWEQAKKYIRQFLLLFLIIMAASAIMSQISPEKDIHTVGSFIAKMVSVLVSAVIAVVSTRIYLDVADGKRINFNHFTLNTRAKRRVIAKWIWGYVLFSVILLAGFILLIIPGIFFAIRLSFRQYYLIDQNMGVNEALRASRDSTKGHERQLLSTGLILVGINILGALALGIGLLRAAPTAKVAFANLYKKITA